MVKVKYEGEDLVSKLPDSITGLILSCLPTKDAVQTCVLSKDWRYMWTHITKLSFDAQEAYYYKKRKKFRRFVSSVLDNLDGSTIIQSFSVILPRVYCTARVYDWIPDLSNLRVKEIYIQSEGRLWISLNTLLKSTLLEVLVLKGCEISVPTLGSLASLTVLKFSNVMFLGPLNKSAENLTLNFPALRELEIKESKWFRVKSVTFEVPMLEVLLIQQPATWMYHDESEILFKFCATRLTHFWYVGYMLTVPIDLSTVQKIASASVDPIPHKFMNKGDFAFHVSKLLKQFNNKVECLKFEQSEVLALAQDNLVAFGMLSLLELGKVTGQVLLHILRNTPFLRILIFKELLQFDEELSNRSDNVPSCFMSHLQVVKFGSLNGDKHELCFTKFVMENALVLEMATFFPTLALRSSKFTYEKVREEILSFKRSVNCVFIED